MQDVFDGSTGQGRLEWASAGRTRRAEPAWQHWLLVVHQNIEVRAKGYFFLPKAANIKSPSLIN